MSEMISAVHVSCTSKHLYILLLVWVSRAATQQLNCTSCGFSGQDEVADSTKAACSFTQQSGPKPFCSYKQACVNTGGSPWLQKRDWIEVIGSGADYLAFSTLQSSRLRVSTSSCLRFYFAQTMPSKLTVIMDNRCTFLGGEIEREEMVLGELDIAPGNITIEFRAQNLAKESTWVRLKNVTLQAGSCNETSQVLANSANSSLATIFSVTITLLFSFLCGMSVTHYLLLL